MVVLAGVLAMTTITVQLDEDDARRGLAALAVVAKYRPVSLKPILAAIEAALPAPIEWHTYGDVTAVAEMDGRVAVHYLRDQYHRPVLCALGEFSRWMTVEEAEHWLRTGEVPA